MHAMVCGVYHEIGCDDRYKDVPLDQATKMLIAVSLVSLLLSALSNTCTKQGLFPRAITTCKLCVYIGFRRTPNGLWPSVKILIFCVIVHTLIKTFNPIPPAGVFSIHISVNVNLQDVNSFQKPVQITTTVIEIDKNPFETDIVRGPNKPPKKGTIDARESVGSSRPYGAYYGDCYGHSAGHVNMAVSQKTVPTGSGLLFNYRTLEGDDCERDNSHAVAVQSVNKTNLNASLCQNNLLGSNDFHQSNSNQKNSLPGSDTASSKTASINTSQPQTLKGTIPVIIRDNMEVPKPHAVENSFTATACNYAGCYLKPSYPVLVGNTVRTCNTKLYASLPQQNKYMVKQRVRDASGATKIKLVLKSSNERLVYATNHLARLAHMYCNIYNYTYIAGLSLG